MNRQMKRLPIIAVVLASLTLVACSKPDIVPAPDTRADTKIHFEGIVNGTDIEWTKNVNGYYAAPNSVLTYDSVSGSNAYQFYSFMQSDANLASFGLGLGSIIHDPEVSEKVSQDAFSRFFSTDSTYSFSTNALNGVEIVYSDASGRLYKSEEAFPGTVTFKSFQLLQDNDGDYMQFEADVDCTVYSFQEDTMTATIQGATFTGYFVR